MYYFYKVWSISLFCSLFIEGLGFYNKGSDVFEVFDFNLKLKDFYT